jgi:hypothetical protein
VRGIENYDAHNNGERYLLGGDSRFSGHLFTPQRTRTDPEPPDREDCHESKASAPNHWNPSPRSSRPTFPHSAFAWAQQQFLAAPIYASGESLKEVGDFNKDGKLDLVTVGLTP